MTLSEELRRQLEFMREENKRLRDAYVLLLKPMQGIASCATRCGCCELHRSVAMSALSAVAGCDSTVTVDKYSAYAIE
jgi:uncharacterized ferredoxin-like protein